MEYGNRIQEWWDMLKPKILQTFTRLDIDEELIHILDNTLFELGRAANTYKVCFVLYNMTFLGVSFIAVARKLRALKHQMME